MPNAPNAYNLNPGKETSDNKPENIVSLRNIVIWIFGILLATITLLITPFVRLGLQDNYNNWFNDIFNTHEIVILSVSLAIPAIFQFFSAKQTRKALLLGAFLLLSTFLCIVEYSVLKGISEFALQTGSEKQPMYKLGSINAIILIIMFGISFVSFINPREKG